MERTDQTGRMRRLVCVYVVRGCNKIRVSLRLGSNEPFHEKICSISFNTSTLDQNFIFLFFNLTWWLIYMSPLCCRINLMDNTHVHSVLPYKADG